MTDEQIIKALECCPKAELAVDCEKLGCPMLQKGGCAYVVHSDLDSDTDVLLEGLTTDALEVINRQKAEIERLKKPTSASAIQILAEQAVNSVDRTPQFISEIKAEAIKEFAERLKEFTYKGFWETHGYVSEAQIDYVTKEMAGDNDESKI